ncbi:MAG TPA: 5'-nucleotidase C-terminal domain-containing protein, partial [Geminicoccaceae bacterium]|nr:5'-nucleotidase C-terminal domain-containing protein [Geminicoccaceae bacterium]
VKILQVNDWDSFGEDEGRGGFARLLAVLEAEDAAANDVLFVHAGDALSPSLLSGFDHGAHMVALLNELPLDVFVMGNHEFDFGPDVARERLAEAEFPVLNANVTLADGTPFPGTTESRLIEVEGYKLGFFGLTTPETPEISSLGGTRFAPVLETAKAMGAKLREAGADLVVAVAHVGRADDQTLYDAGVADLVLSGHDHDLRILYNGKVALVESGSQADYVTAIELTVDRVKDGDEEELVWSPSFRAIDTATVAPSERGLELVKVYEDALSEELDVPVGTTTTELDSRRATVRAQEAAIGNLIADAMRAAVGADLAITNGGGIRGNKTYPAGTELKRRDVLTELPFGNKTAKLELTGADIVEALEHGFDKVEEGAGRFPQISGMTVTVDLTKPAGARVRSVKVGADNLDPSGTYTVATNDFMARGGDGYAAFVGATNLIDPAAARLMASQVIEHVAAAGTVSPTVEGRIATAN